MTVNVEEIVGEVIRFSRVNERLMSVLRTLGRLSEDVTQLHEDEDLAGSDLTPEVIAVLEALMHAAEAVQSAHQVSYAKLQNVIEGGEA